MKSKNTISKNMMPSFQEKKEKFEECNRSFAKYANKIKAVSKKCGLYNPSSLKPSNEAGKFFNSLSTEEQQLMIPQGIPAADYVAGAAFDIYRLSNPFKVDQPFAGRENDPTAQEKLIQSYDEMIPYYKEKTELAKNILNKMVAQFGAKNTEILHEILEP